MLLYKKRYNKIIKRGKNVFEILENYDKTKEWPLGKERIDITLSKRMLLKLKEHKNKTGEPISRIIEESLAFKFNNS